MVSLESLGLAVNQEEKVIKFNEQEIKVKQYLPVNDKLELISKVINQASASDDNNFINPLKVRLFAALHVVAAYTDIEMPKELSPELYDIVYSSGLFLTVQDVIPQDEWDTLMRGLWDSITEIYKYQDSVLGILEAINQDYSNLNFDVSEMQKNLSDPNNLAFLKEVLTKLG